MLKNRKGQSADDPCSFGYCSEDDYEAWRELAVAVRRTLIERKGLSRPLSDSEVSALNTWLTEWIDEGGGTIETALAKAKALREADPRDVPLRWPVTWESSILVPVPITVARRISAIKEIAAYGERGDRLADALGVEKAFDHEEAAKPPPRTNGGLPGWAWGLIVGVPVVAAAGAGGYVYLRRRVAVGAKRPHKAGNPAVCTPGAYGELSTEQRSAFSASAFGLPERRAYPMPDVSHARNAKARAAAQYQAGKLSRSDFERVARKADRIIAGCRRESA